MIIRLPVSLLRRFLLFKWADPLKSSIWHARNDSQKAGRLLVEFGLAAHPTVAMNLTIEQAIQQKTDPYLVFSWIICLDWCDGPISGLLSLCTTEFRFDLVAHAVDFDLRVFQLRQLPFGTLDRFLKAMRSFGVIAQDLDPPRPCWVPNWEFANTNLKVLAESETKRLLELATAPSIAICWDIAHRCLIAARSFSPSDPMPRDWFGWLGIKSDDGD